MADIELTQVARRYGDREVLRGIDLEIERGQRVAIIGPSGGGKSTLLGIIGGSVAATAGKVVVAGRDLGRGSVGELRAHRRTLGWVPQDRALTRQLSVHRNVLGGALPGWSWPKVLLSAVWPVERERVHEALERVGLADRQWASAEVLSGGEAQRVAVARALFGAPTLVIADEPTASLDPVNAEMVTDLLAEEAQARALTLLMSTHWVSLVDGRFDRVIGVRDGELVLDVEPAQLDDAKVAALYAGSDERR